MSVSPHGPFLKALVKSKGIFLRYFTVAFQRPNRVSDGGILLPRVLMYSKDREHDCRVVNLSETDFVELFLNDGALCQRLHVAAAVNMSAAITSIWAMLAVV